MVFPTFVLGSQSDKQHRGEVTNTFLLVNPSVRAAALGGDQSALDGHFDALFSNPAGLGTVSIPEAWLAHNRSFIDTQYSNIGFAAPVTKGVFGFSVNYTDYGKEEKTEESGGQPVLGLGDFRYSTLLAHAAWAQRINSSVFLGGTLKSWNNKQDDVSQTGWATDVGILFKRLIPATDLAFSAKNLGPRYDDHELPSIASVGAAVHLPLRLGAFDKTALYSQFDFPNYRNSAARIGLEFDSHYFQLRGGYETVTSDTGDGLQNFTFGAGLNIKGWQLDYAWVPKGDLGDQHQLSLMIGFGLSAEERAEAARQLDIAMEARLKDRARQYYQSGLKAVAEGNMTLAAKELENATIWDPQYMDAHLELDRVQEKMQLFEANDYYAEAIKYVDQQQWLDAAFYLKKTLKLVPSHIEAAELLKKTELAMQENKLEEKEDITLTDRQFTLGVKYYLDENYAAALREWKMLEKKSSNRTDLREYIAKAEKMQALSELEALKKEKIDETRAVDALSKKAYFYYSMNQIDKAIEAWERVVALDPNNQDAMDALKKARERKNLTAPSEAAAKSREIYELNSRAMNAYVNGDLDGAAVIWRQALQIEPDNIRLQNNLKRIESEIAGHMERR